MTGKIYFRFCYIDWNPRVPVWAGEGQQRVYPLLEVLLGEVVLLLAVLVLGVGLEPADVAVVGPAEPPLARALPGHQLAVALRVVEVPLLLRADGRLASLPTLPRPGLGLGRGLGGHGARDRGDLGHGEVRRVLVEEAGVQDVHLLLAPALLLRLDLAGEEPGRGLQLRLEPLRRDAVPRALHLGLRDHAGEAVVVSVVVLEQVRHGGEAAGDAGVLHPVLHHQVGLQVRPEAAALPAHQPHTPHLAATPNR